MEPHVELVSPAQKRSSPTGKTFPHVIETTLPAMNASTPSMEASTPSANACTRGGLAFMRSVIAFTRGVLASMRGVIASMPTIVTSVASIHAFTCPVKGFMCPGIAFTRSATTSTGSVDGLLRSAVTSFPVARDVWRAEMSQSSLSGGASRLGEGLIAKKNQKSTFDLSWKSKKTTEGE